MSDPDLPLPKDEISTPPSTMAPPPTLPPLTAEDILQVFRLSHDTGAGDQSIDGTNMAPFDFDKLAFLGGSLIHFAVTKYLFNQKQPFNVDIEDLRREYTKPPTLAGWTSMYDNFSSLEHGLGDNEGERARLFSAYVGGLYLQDDIKGIEGWIEKLVTNTPKDTVLNSPATPLREQETTPPSTVASTKLQHASTGSDLHTQTPTHGVKREREVSSGGEGRSSPSPKRTRLSSSTSSGVEGHAVSESSSPSIQRVGPVSIVTHAPSFIPVFADIPNASSSGAATSSGAVTPNQGVQPSTSQPQKKWMSVLNEACMVNRASRTWATESEGADHSKTWRATLTVPEMGVVAVGEGKTKKLAQEEAARKVCERLNWTQTYKW